eukprot:4543171-Pyramimonas_sp.AAC.1
MVRTGGAGDAPSKRAASSAGGGGGGRGSGKAKKAKGNEHGLQTLAAQTNCGRCMTQPQPGDLVLCGSRCKKLWVIAYSHMTEETLSEKYQTDVEFKNSVDLAERVFEGKVDRSLFPSSITRDDMVEMVAVGRFRGYTSSEFKDDFGMTFSDAGFKVRDIPASDG